MTEHVSRNETAALLRKAIKRQFPGAKISVRQDRSSIDVTWIDGPALDDVERIAAAFEGKSLDGMIDMQYYKTSYILPDGSVIPAGTNGTEGSMGTVPAHHAPMPAGAREVCFSSYVFCTRLLSPAAMHRQVDAFLGVHHCEPPKLCEWTDYKTGAPYCDFDSYGWEPWAYMLRKQINSAAL